MAIEPKLEIKQSQSLLMTPQLRQAINLLQMSNLELNNLIEEELASNPLLEREENRLNEYSSEEKNIDNYDEDRNTSVETEENFKLDIGDLTYDVGFKFFFKVCISKSHSLPLEACEKPRLGEM